jgi:hypothetical protein
MTFFVGNMPAISTAKEAGEGTTRTILCFRLQHVNERNAHCLRHVV